MGFIKGFLKFLPVFVLAGLMISGQDAMIAAPLAFVCAVVVAMAIEKKKWQECLDAAMGGIGSNSCGPALDPKYAVPEYIDFSAELNIT